MIVLSRLVVMSFLLHLIPSFSFFFFLQLKAMHVKSLTCGEIPANPCSDVQFMCSLHACERLYTHSHTHSLCLAVRLHDLL